MAANVAAWVGQALYREDLCEECGKSRDGHKDASGDFYCEECWAQFDDQICDGEGEGDDQTCDGEGEVDEEGDESEGGTEEAETSAQKDLEGQEAKASSLSLLEGYGEDDDSEAEAG